MTSTRYIPLTLEQKYFMTPLSEDQIKSVMPPEAGVAVKPFEQIFGQNQPVQQSLASDKNKKIQWVWIVGSAIAATIGVYVFLSVRNKKRRLKQSELSGRKPTHQTGQEDKVDQTASQASEIYGKSSIVI